MIPKEDWISSKAEIRNDSISGKGLFAIKSIQEGEDVLKWGGDYVNSTEAEKARSQGKLVMQFDDNLFSVEDKGESNAYFLNHSCNPNLWMKDAFTLQAKRNIDVGEELTADYAMWETDENYISKWECLCNTADCRHRVTGKDWLLKKLQRNYINHFIPLINRRIESLKTIL